MISNTFNDQLTNRPFDLCYLTEIDNIKQEPIESISPYHLFAVSSSPQPLSPAAIPPPASHTPTNQLHPTNIPSYNLPPNIQFGETYNNFHIPTYSQQQLSPHYNHNIDNNQFNIHLKQQQQPLPPVTALSMNNLNGVTAVTSNAQHSEPSNLSSLMDMDSQQFTHINSADLSGLSLSLIDGTYGANPDTDQLRLQQQQQQEHQQLPDDLDQDNMADSFTRIAIRELNDLNNMCNNNNNRNN